MAVKVNLRSEFGGFGLIVRAGGPSSLALAWWSQQPWAGGPSSLARQAVDEPSLTRNGHPNRGLQHLFGSSLGPRIARSYLTQSVYKVVLPKSILVRIRQLILHIG